MIGTCFSIVLVLSINSILIVFSDSIVFSDGRVLWIALSPFQHITL